MIFYLSGLLYAGKPDFYSVGSAAPVSNCRLYSISARLKAAITYLLYR